MTTNPSNSGTQGEMFLQADVAQAWQRGAALRGQVFGPATDVMLDLADLKPGDRVLDIAAGTGDTSILAAGRVGPTGRVVATDVSASMLEVAAEAVRQAGLTNIETHVMDARSLDLETESFDAIISRMGIMLIPEREKALAEILRVLKPGARLAAIVWSTAERNLGAMLPLSIGRRHAKLPPPLPDAPGMFALGAPGLLARTLTEAGFRDVTVQAVPTPRRYPSASAMMHQLTECSPLLRDSLSGLDQDGRDAMLAEIEATLRQFEGPDGIIVPGEVLVGVGKK
jgi:SAM-dependent methyltransferase